MDAMMALSFGQMISGTPDLVQLGKNFIIWDFKTGSIKDHSLNSYWFQLLCYAFAYWELGHVEKNKLVTLKLSYVDEQRVLKVDYSYSDVRNYIFSQLKRLENLDQVNLDYCNFCGFIYIC